MPDKLTKATEIAAQAQDLFGDDELEQFTVEYWAKRGIDYRELHKYSLDYLFSLKEIKNVSES